MYIYECMLVVPKDYQPIANQLAMSLTNNPADTLTFSVPLSQSGNTPATHYGCSALLTEIESLQIAQMSIAIPGAHYFYWNSKDDLLKQSNANAPLGIKWGINESLVALDLKVIK